MQRMTTLFTHLSRGKVEMCIKGGRHSSVDLSAPNMMRPGVRIPTSTQSKVFYKKSSYFVFSTLLVKLIAFSVANNKKTKYNLLVAWLVGERKNWQFLSFQLLFCRNIKEKLFIEIKSNIEFVTWFEAISMKNI